MTVSFGGVAGGAANDNSGRSLAPQAEVGSSGRIRIDSGLRQTSRTPSILTASELRRSPFGLPGPV